MTNPTHVKSLITEGPVTVGEVFEVYSVDPTGSVLVNEGVGGMWTLCQGEYEPYTPLDELAELDSADTPKTLKELDAKPGDVVAHVSYQDGSCSDYKFHFTIEPDGGARGASGFWLPDSPSLFRLISRASDAQPEPTIEPVTGEAHLTDWDRWRMENKNKGEPKPFGQMSDAERGALLLAHHRGEEIESHNRGHMPGEEWSVTTFPSWTKTALYRIKPKTVIDERVMPWYTNNDNDRQVVLANTTYRDGKLIKVLWEEGGEI